MGWALADQAVSSLTNAVAALVVAGSVSRGSFGAFSTAVLIYTLVVSGTRGLIAQPLAIRVSTHRDQRGEVSAAAGAGLVAGAASGVVVGVAGGVVGGAVGGALAVTGVMLPALVLQDVWRYALITMRRPQAALVNDLAWGAGQVVLLAVALRAADGEVTALTAAWAGAGAVAAALGVAQAGVAPAWREAAGYLRRHGALGGRFAVDLLLTTGSSQVTVLAVGVAGGVAAVGAVRAGSLLFGPFTVALAGLMAGGIAEGARLAARAPHRLRPVLVGVSAGLLALSVGWGAVLGAAPASWGEALLGPSWAGAHRLVLPFTVVTAGTAVGSGAVLGLRVAAAARTALRLRLLAGTVTVAGGLAGAAAAGATGGVWGLAGGTWVNAVGSWWALGRRGRGGRVPVPERRASAGPAAGPAVPAAGGPAAAPASPGASRAGARW